MRVEQRSVVATLLAGMLAAGCGGPQAPETTPAADEGQAASPTVAASPPAAETEADRAVRRAPRAPEIGSGRSDTERVCEEQRGTVLTHTSPDRNLALICEVGGRRIFSVHLAGETQTADAVDTWVEDGDLDAIRAELELRWGPGTEGAAGGDEPTWTWLPTGEAWTVRRFGRGVWISTEVVVEN